MKRFIRFLKAEIQWVFYKFVDFLSKAILLPHMALASSTPNLYEKFVVEKDIAILMRDGVRLYADIYKPPVAGKYPVILTRLPYGKGEYRPYRPAYGRFWAKKGYVCIVQDVRGKWRSEGEFQPMAANECEDGYDTVDWIAQQPWCDGNIGMVGDSYDALTQWAAAVMNHPSLKCIAPMDIGLDEHRLRYHGGAFNFQLSGSWALSQSSRTERNSFRIDYWYLPLITLDDDAKLPANLHKETIKHPSRSAFWDETSLITRIDQVQIPVLHVGGWYDMLLRGTIEGWKGVKEKSRDHEARENQWLLIGPSDHERTPDQTNRIGKLRIGGDWNPTWFNDRQQQFFDYWLKGIDNGWNKKPPVEIFVIGDDKWRYEYEFPLERAIDTKYFFHSQGSANTRDGDGTLDTQALGEEPADQYIYDPNDPVTIAMEIDYWSLAKYLKDRQFVEGRQDVLVYTSAELEEDLEITGPISVTLYAASSARDTDFTAALVDVFPDGYCHMIQEGIIRARFRDSEIEPTLIEPGEVYQYNIDLWATSYVIKKGHRIRVEISSSNFNRYDRNPNTGNEFGMDDEMVEARQTIYHNKEYMSHITLPIIPR